MFVSFIRIVGLSMACFAMVQAESVWEPFGLDGLEVWDIETDGVYLYATVYDPPGLYRRYLDHPDSSWTLLGSDGADVAGPIWTTVARPGWVYVGYPCVHRSGDSGLTWEPATVGIPGHPLQALAGSSHNPYLIYAYLDFSRLYCSTNGADSWECCVDEFSGFAGIYPLFDPHDAERIWVLAGSGFEGAYLYRSNDLGATWDLAYARPLGVLGGLDVDAFTGRVYLEDGGRIFVSDDGGDNWEEILSLVDEVGEISYVVSLVGPWNGADVVIAGHPASGSPGIWISRDAGETWNPRAEGLPADAPWIFPLRADIRHPGVIYAGVIAESGDRGVWRIELDDVIVLDASEAQASSGGMPPLRVLVNPASGEVTFEAADATIGDGDRLLVLDAAGRVVSAIEGSKEGNMFRWTGRDASGRSAPAGTYFAAFDRGGKRTAAKFVWLRK
jgi:hypothetical protein